MIRKLLRIFCIKVFIWEISEGHGYLSSPKAVYINSSYKTWFITTASANQLYPGIKWNDSPDNNSKQYQKLQFKDDLKSFYTSRVQGCPKNKLDVVIDVSNLTSMKWQNDEFKEGFISSHTGPCEAWIDDIKVFTNNDCVATYRSYPAELPIDYSKCKKVFCLFEFYWMALHEPEWQLYKGCAMISGNNIHSKSAITKSNTTIHIKEGNKVNLNCSPIEDEI